MDLVIDINERMLQIESVISNHLKIDNTYVQISDFFDLILEFLFGVCIQSQIKQYENKMKNLVSPSVKSKTDTGARWLLQQMLQLKNNLDDVFEDYISTDSYDKFRKNL